MLCALGSNIFIHARRLYFREILDYSRQLQMSRGSSKRRSGRDDDADYQDDGSSRGSSAAEEEGMTFEDEIPLPSAPTRRSSARLSSHGTPMFFLHTCSYIFTFKPLRFNSTFIIQLDIFFSSVPTRTIDRWWFHSSDRKLHHDFQPPAV